MHAWFQTRFSWGNTQYRETAVLSGDFWLCIIPLLPHFAFLSHIISYNEYIVILFRSKECEDLFLFKCFLNWTIRYMKGIIVRIPITEITCRYYDNQNNIACTSCSEAKLPRWRTPQLFTVFALRHGLFMFFSEGREKSSLKSGISLQQRNVRLNSRRNIFVMSPIIVYLVYHHQKISAIELLLFWSWKWRHENSLHNMASLSSCLARRIRKMTGILSSDWWH